VYLNGLEAQFGAIYDEKQEAGTERRRRVGSEGEVEGEEREEREVPLTLQQWLQQRLSNVHRTGPASQPWLFLALVAAVDAKHLAMISQAVCHSLPMIEYPGSKDFYTKVTEDMAAIAEWRGPAAFFFSISLNTAVLDIIATLYSVDVGMAGEGEEVWHSADEEQELTARPGREKPHGPVGYYVHSVSNELDDSCPFHYNCIRSNLETIQER
jgi:hypothetical protein